MLSVYLSRAVAGKPRYAAENSIDTECMHAVVCLVADWQLIDMPLSDLLK